MVTSSKVVKKKLAHFHGALTYHHLIDGLDDVVHLRASYEAIVVDVVEFKSPWSRKKKVLRIGAHLRVYL